MKPAVTPGGTPGGTSVTIVAYHAVEEGFGPLCLPPPVFRSQVEALLAAGCRFLTMGEVAGHLAEGRAFPPRAVALTFDDGYASVHEVALPVLAELGGVATVYPVTGELGGYNRWDEGKAVAPRLALAGGGQVAELVAEGWDLGCHTHTHAPLPGLPPAAAEAELVRSVGVLEDLAARPVPTFAYPFGRHDRPTRDLAARHFAASLTIGAGRARLGDASERLARVDAWYLRSPWSQRHLLDGGGDAYLLLRRLARRARARLVPGG